MLCSIDRVKVGQMRPLQQKGIERCGTTVAAKMVRQAFGIQGMDGKRVKHELIGPGSFTPDTALMINIKDPYSWMVSWHAWAQQAKYSGYEIPGKKLPVSFNKKDVTWGTNEFNERYRNWMTAGYDFAVIRYEDILMNPAVLYEKIAKLLDVEPDPTQMWEAMPLQIVRPARTKMRGLPAIKFDRAYYEEKRYLDLLSKLQIEQITEEIDWELFKGLYGPIS